MQRGGPVYTAQGAISPQAPGSDSRCEWETSATASIPGGAQKAEKTSWKAHRKPSQKQACAWALVSCIHLPKPCQELKALAASLPVSFNLVNSSLLIQPSLPLPYLLAVSEYSNR